jgi:hypothetical protein
LDRLGSESIIKRNDGFLEAEIDGEIVILSVELGTCYGLNKVGSRIWQLLAQSCRVDDLCAILISEYRIDREMCERQVLELLEALQSEGMIRSVESV